MGIGTNRDIVRDMTSSLRGIIIRLVSESSINKGLAMSWTWALVSCACAGVVARTNRSVTASRDLLEHCVRGEGTAFDVRFKVQIATHRASIAHDVTTRGRESGVDPEKRDAVSVCGTDTGGTRNAPLSYAISLKSVPWTSDATPTRARRRASFDDANNIFCFTLESSGDLISAIAWFA